MSFNELRQRYPEFIFDAFTLKEASSGYSLSFEFRVGGDIVFRPTLELGEVSEARIGQLGEKGIARLAASLGMIEAVSYWKATCSPRFVVRAVSLSEVEIVWWNAFYRQALGEFYYTNNIDFTAEDLLRFDVVSSEPVCEPIVRPVFDRHLVLFGGGKDSVVTAGILRRGGVNFDGFALAPTQAAIDCARAAGCELRTFARRIDPELLALNKRGFLNGHTPISAYYAFAGVAAGLLFDYDTILVSNEGSANEGNIEYRGRLINHQYSKSFEMEQALRNYFSEFLAPSVDYFSFLRPLNEFQISEIFSRFAEFHEVFRSCNRGSKTNTWCGACPKCAFVYVMLRPFLKDRVSALFGRDLFGDDTLLPIFEALLQVEGRVKPFECVGTKDEVAVALGLALGECERGKSVPLVLQSLADRGLIDAAVALEAARKLTAAWNPEHALPSIFSDLLRTQVPCAA